jgi:putative transcriptional regulator
MNEAFKSISNGLEEAIAHSKKLKTDVITFAPNEVNVKQVREKTGLTQTRFAATLGISVKTLRNWEQGKRKPHGPALVLLNAVERDHGKLLEILTDPISASC